MVKLTKEQVIDALKQAYAVERKFRRGNVFAKQLEEAYNALLTALDDIWLDAVNVFEHGVAASLLHEQQVTQEYFNSPFFALARYAYNCVINDLIEQATKANGGKELRYGAARDLIARTIDTIAARFGN